MEAAATEAELMLLGEKTLLALENRACSLAAVSVHVLTAEGTPSALVCAPKHRVLPLREVLFELLPLHCADYLLVILAMRLRKLLPSPLIPAEVVRPEAWRLDATRTHLLLLVVEERRASAVFLIRYRREETAFFLGHGSAGRLSVWSRAVT